MLFYNPHEVPKDLELDAILVLGGGVPISLEEPPIYVQRRCDDAVAVLRNRSKNTSTTTSTNTASDDSPSTATATLQQQQKNLHLPILCLSAGTAHLPQLMDNNNSTSGGGLPIWESTSSAAYLLRHYCPNNEIIPSQLFVETTSYDTIGNAFFARTTHTDWHGWRKLLIITNEFHMRRTRAIFDWIFGISSSNSRNKEDDDDDDIPYQLYYLESPNVGLTEEAVQARREREEKSLQSVQDHLAPTYTTLSQVAKFLYHHHDLYTASKLVERSQTKKATTTTDATTALQASYGGVALPKEK